MSNQIRLGTQKTPASATGYIGMWLGAQDNKTSAFTVSGTNDTITLTTPQNWFDQSAPMPVKVRSTTTLPTGLSATLLYYAVFFTTSTVKLASNLDNALAGTFISPTTAGSGTHTIYKARIDDVSGQGNHLLFEAAGMTDTVAFGTANYMNTAAGSSGQCFAVPLATMSDRWSDPYNDLFVLAFRSKGTLPGSTLAIMGNSTGSSVPGFRLRSTAAGLASPTIDRTTSGVTSLGSTSATAFEASTEHSFVMFLDGQNALIDVYIDGVIDSNFNAKDISASLTEAISPFVTNFYVGGNSTAVTQAWSFRWMHMLVANAQGAPSNKLDIARWLHSHGHMPLPQSLWGLQ